MRLLKILRILSLFFPIAIYGQVIQENLEYINAQFDQFNKFQTSFDVDKVSKKIICRDKFGMYSALLKDIEIKKDESGKNIGIYCLDESKCISSLKKDGSKGPGFSNYTIEFSQNGALVSTVDTVLEKFTMIKKAVLENNFVISNSQISTLKYQVDLQLEELNAIFKAHSLNQNQWHFDWDNYWLVQNKDSCIVQIPLEKITINYFERENAQSFRHGFIIKSIDSDIIEKCTKFEHAADEIHDYLDSFSNTETAIDYLKNIQNLLSDEPSSLSPSSYEGIDQLLGYVNEQFKNYNQFNTRFFVDLTEMELIWIQDFGETRAPIDQIDFKADYGNGWVVIICKNENHKCISFTNPGGTKFQYTEFSMSLKDQDKVISHIDKVIEKFRKLQEKILEN